MKKLLLLVLAMTLALTLLPASAETEVPEALYRIVLRTEEGDTTLGTGVLYGTQKTLLTVRGCWAEVDLVAIGGDGEHAVTYRGEIVDSQLILLGLATECDAEPLTVTQADYLADYTLYGAAPAGGMTAMEVTFARMTIVNRRAEALLTAQEGLLPGAVMLGDDDGLAYIVAGQYGEGVGVYVAIADVTLNALLNEEAAPAKSAAPRVLAPTPTPAPTSLPTPSPTPVPAAPAQPDGPQFVRGFRVEADNGLLTVDWSDALTVPATEETVFTVNTTIITNPYVTFDKVSGGKTSTTFPAVPGTEVMVWVVRSEGELAESVYPTSAADVAFAAVPEAEPFTRYGLKNLRCGVTSGEPGLEGNPADFLPERPLTRETLSDPDATFYFQTEDTYQVAQEDDDHTLLVSLHMPDGSVYYYHSGYVFMPEMNEKDLWAADITALLEDYASFTPEALRWPAGEYTVLYTIDGGEVARFTFTLD